MLQWKFKCTRSTYVRRISPSNTARSISPNASTTTTSRHPICPTSILKSISATIRPNTISHNNTNTSAIVRCLRDSTKSNHKSSDFSTCTANKTQKMLLLLFIRLYILHNSDHHQNCAYGFKGFESFEVLNSIWKQNYIINDSHWIHLWCN